MDGDAVPRAPGEDEDPSGLPPAPEAGWLSEEDYQAYLACLASAEDAGEPGDPWLFPDPEDCAPPPGEDELTAEQIVGCREITAEQAARRVPGEYAGPAAGFAIGLPLDVMAGCPELALFAAGAAGEDDGYADASDDELLGALCAWDRIEAHAAARKHAAAAEFIRRRPAPGCVHEGAARMPARWEEFASDELSQVLAESRWAAENMLDLAHDLAVKLPGTNAAFRSGVLREAKAATIARACQVLSPQEARAAEALVLGRAGTLTPGGLRAAIARAVIQVAPDKARKRRENAARDARVERWAEDSGNAALAGRELPPAAVLAADQRVSAWARELRKAGLDGSTDELRARAYLDLLLGVDSRPAPTAPDSTAASAPGAEPPGAPDSTAASAPGAEPPDGGPLAGVVPAGFAARVNLIVPLQTLTEMADRPGELAGIGPVDPWLARDLAAAAARHSRTTWCVTVTDNDGHAIGHGCARPQPRNQRKHAGPGSREGRDPPGGPAGAGFTFTAAGQPRPPGGYGTWRLRAPAGAADLIVALGPVAIDDCDHRHETKGHDPGVMLRHLAQIRHATCTGPTCRRPAAQCDFEHNIPYEAGGRTCLCNGGPKCRHEHRLKQDPRWKVEQVTPGTFRWTTPSGRTRITEPTRYPT